MVSYYINVSSTIFLITLFKCIYMHRYASATTIGIILKRKISEGNVLESYWGERYIPWASREACLIRAFWTSGLLKVQKFGDWDEIRTWEWWGNWKVKVYMWMREPWKSRTVKKILKAGGDMGSPLMQVDLTTADSLGSWSCYQEGLRF